MLLVTAGKTVFINIRVLSKLFDAKPLHYIQEDFMSVIFNSV